MIEFDDDGNMYCPFCKNTDGHLQGVAYRRPYEGLWVPVCVLCERCGASGPSLSKLYKGLGCETEEDAQAIALQMTDALVSSLGSSTYDRFGHGDTADVCKLTTSNRKDKR